jgi:cobyrinic acid a,c-diamide synthase
MVNRSVPRLVVGAAASGSGKTTIAAGLMAALRATGRTVAGFKVGPDYIDPGYHAVATGRPGRNLDPVLVGEDLIGPLFAHGARDADIALVEGVMGLFDGRLDTDGFGSTAHVAKLIGAPVLFVVDARGQGDSLAALLHGFLDFDPDLRPVAVVLNKVGSARHELVLTKACARVGLDVVGVVPREQAAEVPSRHLGLVTAAEHGPRAREAIEAVARVVADNVDLSAVLALAATDGPPATPWWPEITPVGTPTVAVAGGASFTFAYPETVECLVAAGAEVVSVDPLTDPDLPEGTDGLLLPGGFPEAHAEALSANVALREAVARFAADGGPVYAECGGLLYLGADLDGLPMCRPG